VQLLFYLSALGSAQFLGSSQLPGYGYLIHNPLQAFHNYHQLAHLGFPQTKGIGTVKLLQNPLVHSSQPLEYPAQLGPGPVSELPVKAAHTQQQQREAWQRQIDEVKERERKLQQKAGLQRNIEQERKQRKEEQIGENKTQTFEIIELVGRNTKETRKTVKTKDDGIHKTKGLELFRAEKKNNIPEEKEIVRANLYRKSLYIQGAEKILKELNEKQSDKNIPELVIEDQTDKNLIDVDSVTLQKEEETVQNLKVSLREENSDILEKQLDENQIKSILLENISTKKGLKAIIKKLLKEKLKF